MPSNNHSLLSVKTIVGAVKRHGLTLERGTGFWFDDLARTCCAGGGYALACDPLLFGIDDSSTCDILDAVGWDTRLLQGLNDGFEDRHRDWLYWITSHSYRRAFRIGRAVYRASRSMERAVGPFVPPLTPGRPDGGLAADGSTESPSESPALELAGVGADDFNNDDHWREYPGG